jgi:hypothetical protein
VTTAGHALVRAVLAAAITMVAAGCFGNDNARDTKLVNGSGIPVRLYLDATDRESAINLAVGVTKISGVMWPIDNTDDRTRTVLAEDLSGKLVYCERFTYQDLARVKWTITIEVRNSCGAPPASGSPGSRP